MSIHFLWTKWPTFRHNPTWDIHHLKSSWDMTPPDHPLMRRIRRGVIMKSHRIIDRTHERIVVWKELPFDPSAYCLIIFLVVVIMVVGHPFRRIKDTPSTWSTRAPGPETICYFCTFQKTFIIDDYGWLFLTYIFEMFIVVVLFFFNIQPYLMLMINIL